jgi:hypothetical protein
MAIVGGTGSDRIISIGTGSLVDSTVPDETGSPKASGPVPSPIPGSIGIGSGTGSNVLGKVPSPIPGSIGIGKGFLTTSGEVITPPVRLLTSTGSGTGSWTPVTRGPVASTRSVYMAVGPAGAVVLG